MNKFFKGLLVGILVVGAIGVVAIKNIENTEYGTLITFRNDSGYFIEK